jgi:hypothetical protein
MPPDPASCGWTVRAVAARYRVSVRKVRAWIRTRALEAVCTADPGERPRYVVTPEALERFEAGRQVAPPPKPARRKKRTNQVDYYP